MPDASYQFLPPHDDYSHDLSLAQTASYQARERIAAGEDEATVVKDIISKTVRAYLSTPWVCWYPRLACFLTYGEAYDLDTLSG